MKSSVFVRDRQLLVLFSSLCLCSVFVVGYDSPSSSSSLSSSSSARRWRSSRYNTFSLSRASSRSGALRDPYRYSIRTVDPILRKPKRIESYVPTLNSPASSVLRASRGLSATGSGRVGLRVPKRDAFDTNVESMKAERHFLDMEVRAACGRPRERVICVRDHYPNADIAYLPACTVLHRCDRQSGCCKSPKTCQAASSEQVILFFKTSGTSSQESPSVSGDVLKLTFTNHTSCRCDIDDAALADPRLTATTTTATTATALTPPLTNDIGGRPNEVGQDHAHEREVEASFENGVVDLVDDVAASTADDIEDIEDPLENCQRCPLPFSKRLTRGVCKCDCFDGDAACMNVKNGHTRLAESERRCVHRDACHPPSCTTGRYFDVDFGECRRPTYEKLTLLANANSLSAADAANATDDRGELMLELEDEIAAAESRRHHRRHHRHQTGSHHTHDHQQRSVSSS